jgi:type I restriction enzyme S subunit
VVGFASHDETLTRFIEYFIRTSREKLERFAPATAQKNINLAVLESVAIPIPPASEQRRIVAEVDRCLSLLGGLLMGSSNAVLHADRLRSAVLLGVYASKRIDE